MHKLALALLGLSLASAVQAQPVTNPAPVGSAGAYNSTAPTCTNGNFCFLQVDALGSLKSSISANGNTAGISIDGNLLVATTPAPQFFDAFSTTLDTTTNWTANNSTGTAATSSGTLVVSSSTTASAWGGLSSKQSWAPSGVSLQVYGVWATFTNKTIANTARVWGMFTVPGTPTTAVPATDGYIWRLDGAGSFFAEVWASGAAISSTNITTLCPITNSIPNTYAIYFRTGLIQFYCGATLAATVAGFDPVNQTLPTSAFSIAGSTPPLTSASMTLGGLTLATYAPAGVKGAAQSPTINDPALVVTQSPNAFAVTPTTTAALASNQIVKAAAGQLYSFQVSADSTLSAAAWWIMIFDSTTLPGDGAVTPKKCYAMPSGSTGASFGFSTPVNFTTGIVIGASTTGCFTKTASTHAFISGDAQ